MSINPDALSLADAIASLRNQLRVAQERVAEVRPQDKFRISDVELELTIAAEGSVDGTGEVGWLVFKAGAKASVKDTVTHKLRFKLEVGDVFVSTTDLGD